MPRFLVFCHTLRLYGFFCHQLGFLPSSSSSVCETSSKVRSLIHHWSVSKWLGYLNTSHHSTKQYKTCGITFQTSHQTSKNIKKIHHLLYIPYSHYIFASQIRGRRIGQLQPQVPPWRMKIGKAGHGHRKR